MLQAFALFCRICSNSTRNSAEARKYALGGLLCRLERCNPSPQGVVELGDPLFHESIESSQALSASAASRSLLLLGAFERMSNWPQAVGFRA
jgi:hypothetical protein